MQNYLNRIPNYVIYAWLRILFKSANENILLRLDSFEKPYKQLELVSHRDIRPNTRKQCMKTLALRARVFIHCFLVFGYPGETLALVVHIFHPNGPTSLDINVNNDNPLPCRHSLA